MTILELFPDKIIIESTTNCWLWKGPIHTSGYAYVSFRAHLIRINRLSAHLSLGLDLNDTKIHALHKIECKNKHCCNPDHLYLGDGFDNQRDAVLTGSYVSSNGNKTVCKYGHDYTPENTYIGKKGNRKCRQCQKEYRRNWFLTHGR